MGPAAKRQIDINHLKADVSASAVELLSAQCAADRVRLQYSLQDIVAFSEPQTLKRAIASAEALHRFYSQIAAQIQLLEKGNSGRK
jgi:hypothetical protein